jgi:excisionase family DNA binding protein
MTKDIMDVKEVAEYLALSPTTIYRMLTAGEIPNVKVGGQYRFPKSVIDEWIAGKLDYPKAQMSRRAEAKKPKITEERKSKAKTEAPARAEDMIVGYLLAAKATGSAVEKGRAKQIMLKEIDKLDMAYLAQKAKSAGVLAEAVDVQNELITEASR